MKMKKIMAFAMASLLILSVSVGCNSNNTADNQSNSEVTTQAPESKEMIYKDTIVYAMWSSPDGFFNPTLSNTTYDDAVNGLIYSSLIDYDKDMNIVSGLADKWEVSEDNKTIVFTIKDNVKWHDGIEFTPSDVVFTFEALASSEYDGAYSGIVEKIKGVKEYKEGTSKSVEGIKVDGNKISIELQDTYAPALTDIGGFPIIPKHIWNQKPISEWKTASELLQKPVGTGPYKFVEFVDGHHVKFEANENYYKGEVATQNFIYKIVNRDSVQVALKNGEVDIAEVSDMKKRDLDLLEQDGIETISFSNRMFQYMGFNLRDQRFQDVKVREAFMYGIDRQLMVEKLVGGKGMIVNTPMIPTNWAYPAKNELEPYLYNVEKAKELLKQAGWEDRDEDGIIENKKGEDFEVTLTYPSGDKAREDSAPIIQSYLKNLGIEMKLDMLEFSSTMDKVVGNHEFELYLMGNNLDADPNPKPYWYSTAASDEKGVYGWNIAGFRSEEADQLMDDGLSTNDIEKRKELYNKFGVLMNKELPWVTLYTKDIIMAHRNGLENYNPSTYTKLVDVEKWQIEEQ